MKKQLIIVGAGESGTGAALLGLSKGFDVFVSDAGMIKPANKEIFNHAGIPFEENGHSAERILGGDLIIKSPGIPSGMELLQQAKDRSIEIIDELEFAYRFTSAKIIAITGTNGKTTTTLLTHHLLREAGWNVGLAGNVGTSLARQLASGEEKEWYVIEMSSFQLDGIVSFRPDIAILLNITPDHLDRYHYSMEEYVASKFRITKNQTEDDIAVLNRDDMHITGKESIVKSQIKWISVSGGKADGTLQNGTLYVDDDFHVAQTETALRGPHNALNMLCAITAARLAGVDDHDIKSGLASFKNAPHRLEFVGSVNEVGFFNDSKATNVDAVSYALDSFTEPLIWIVGGIDKGNDYDQIREKVKQKVKALICLGKDNEKLRSAFKGTLGEHWLETDNMQDAVAGALAYADARDVVLLSPACASFDLFSNYIDRGDQFRESVKKLMADNNHVTQ